MEFSRDASVGERPVIAELFAVLRRRGYALLGPTVRDGAIVYDELGSDLDLPVGWTDEQDAGTYRLRRRDDQALFGYVVGPHSWKQYLFPPAARLWTARLTVDGLDVERRTEPPPRHAFIGVRPCELAAIAVQDRVFLEGEHFDPIYAERRARVFVLAVNCGQAGRTCFCASMDTGPQAAGGFDLALTERIEARRHEFLVEPGSERGREVLAELTVRPATEDDLDAARRRLARTAASMGRRLDTRGLRELLYANQEHPRWEEVASRCLACGGCTLACPTCFCAATEDVTRIDDDRAERWRRWDSCFTLGFSFIHGGSVRSSVRSRYRQWMTHKLAGWIDQFGTSGCVGCGRCITWCPVGIDLTEEVRAIRERDAGAASRRE